MTDPREDIDGGGRRLACKKSDYMDNWWVAYSPRNGEGAVAEGNWDHWVEFANNILEADRQWKESVQSSDNPGKRDTQ
ncbi:MAG: hypothetical protein E6R03_13825 [Hyphomicrobiaceae bacterium]|nr:MAG: hypothetical protein E6R03_13825 [Hyphomicrobiaceae bacterium]